uniref:C3H1-type domain-containing protein n=2 Tax=Daucus carota subsp. sativus TaxID=79200 RepID=A0A166GN08_DAUCS|nr:PREDICTED: uncharacterized protein LOC108220134 [Daucus carota subsp. sativus]
MALRSGISPFSNTPVGVYNHTPRSPGFDLRANSNVLNSSENLESPIVRYYRSGGSPLSAIENLDISPNTLFKTSVKVEEDVLVMDGILVGPVAASRVRSSSSTSDSGGSSSSGGKSFYKTEICRSWEDFGTCRYGAKCQFAHGKEELRPTRFFNKSKSETQICRAYSSGTCSYGSQCRFSHEQTNSPASGTDSPFTLASRTVSQNNSPASATDSPIPASKTQAVLPIKLEKAMNCAGRSPLTARTISQNNSPASSKDSPLCAIPSEILLPMKLEKAAKCAGKSPLTTRTTITLNNSPASLEDSPFSVIPSETLLPGKLEESMNCAGKSLSTTQIVSQHNSPASATDSPVSMIPSKPGTVSPINLEKPMTCAGKTSITPTVSPIKLQNAMDCSESFIFANSDWSPLDDDIEVALPCSSSADKALSREEVDAYINRVLYGPSKRKTLPAFAAICPR